MKRRVPTAAGLSYVEANAPGRLVTYGPDVLDVKKQIEELWGGTLECVFDQEQEEWLIIENCRDDVQRLAVPPLTPAQFNPQLLDRLREAFNTSPDEMVAAIDKWNEQVEREEERKLEEIAGDTGERLIHAFKKDGLYDHLDIYGTKNPSKQIRNRAVRPHVERHPG